jgi:hypothetical protein
MRDAGLSRSDANSLLSAFDLFRLTCPHGITRRFEPEQLLTALNDDSRVGLEATQVRVVKRAVGIDGVGNWIGGFDNLEIAVPDGAGSAAVVTAIEGDDADAPELRIAPTGKLPLFLKSVGSDQASSRAACAETPTDKSAAGRFAHFASPVAGASAPGGRNAVP